MSTLPTKMFKEIEMISHRDLCEYAGSRIGIKYRAWNKFKVWTIFTGNDAITDNITYHCRKKDFTLTYESNKMALHYISKDFIKNIFIKNYNYNIDPLDETNEAPQEDKIITIQQPEISESTPEITNFAKATIKTPPLIQLDDNEKFIDDNGRICDIRVYGNKSSSDTIYISLLDIEREFEYEHLSRNILNGRIHLEISKDIEIFNAVIKDPSDRLNKPRKSRIHLTMSGLIKLIANSHNPTMVKYNQWLKDAFFINQMGTQEQKLNLATKIIKSNIEDAQVLLKISSTPVCAVYIISFTDLHKNGNINSDIHLDLKKMTKMLNNIPKPKDLKITTKFPKLYKFGFTDNLNVRLSKYKHDYGDHISLNLVQLVDINNLVKTEEYMREQARALKCKIEMDGYNDWFFTWSEGDLVQYKAVLGSIGKLFGKSMKTFNDEIKTWQERLSWAQSTIETNDKYHVSEMERMELKLKMSEDGREADNKINNLILDNYKLKYELLEMKTKKLNNL